MHPAVCEQLARVKGPTRIALTTDQTAAAGARAGTYTISGRQVVSDGRVVRLEDGTLAGSAATMPDLVRLMAHLARGFRDRPGARYRLTALCIGLGMGAAILWENLAGVGSTEPARIAEAAAPPAP